MNRPPCFAVLLYLGGILAAQCVHVHLTVLFALGFAAGVGALLWPGGRIWLLFFFLLLMGWTRSAQQNDVISPHDLRLLTSGEMQVATVRGFLHASPVPRIYERQGRESWRISAEIDVKEIRLGGAWQPAFGKIIAFAPGLLSSNFFSGQCVEVRGVLGALAGPRAEGLFDARAFYQQHGICRQLRTEADSDWAVCPDVPPRVRPLSDRFSTWARRTLAFGLGPEDPPLRLLWTLALDWKAPLTESVEEPFMRAGTFHIFAVDGLRIGLLAGIGMGLLRVLRLPRAICGVLVIPLIWAYAGLTGWPASAVRAAVMMTILILGWASHRPADLVNSLFAAAFIILLWDANQLFQPGFQLSFIVVLCIAVLVPLIRKWFRSLAFKQDPFLPDALKPRWPPAASAAAMFAVDTCALSLAAWLGSIPLAAAYFHLFTPISVPANIVVVPITALALMSSIGSLLTGAWLPGLAILFNHAGWFFMKCIIEISRWSAQWQPGAWNVATPSPALFLLYYLALFSVLTGWILRSKCKWLTGAAILSLAVVWLGQVVAESKTARVHFVPLDGGAAVFADGNNVLFDCGNPQLAEGVVKPFLRAHGVNTLDFLALTVGHVQDGAGASVVLANFAVRRVFGSAAPALSTGYREAEERVKQTAPWQELRAGDAAGNWVVLHPSRSKIYPTADDNALVFRAEINRHSILLLSALGRSGQDELVEAHPDLRAEIVAASLPARDEPLSEPLLDLLQPRLIIIVDSDHPATRRAAPKLRERLAARRVPVVYCHDTGALKLSLARAGWQLTDPSGKTILTSN